MQVSFIDIVTSEKRFGIMDSELHSEKPAYLDFDLGNNKIWIAEIVNNEKKKLWFTPIDNRLELKKEDRQMQKRCDALLYFFEERKNTIIFIELKERHNSGWKKVADEQLRETIATFEETKEAKLFKIKKAHIANNLRPKSNKDDMPRMKKFMKETGYVLSIGKIVKI